MDSAQRGGALVWPGKRELSVRQFYQRVESKPADGLTAPAIGEIDAPRFEVRQLVYDRVRQVIV